ncbi:MAG TPA: hypothetical protein VKF62_10480 [Planctomycetota bacterium]|nr:hypothetical protein [Planctomycetota bacterium]
MSPSSAKPPSLCRAPGVLLGAFVFLFGVAGECRWKFSSNTSGRNGGSGGSGGQSNNNSILALTLGGPADSVLPARGGRALLYSRTAGTDCGGEIGWLDLGTGRSWTLLHSLHRPSLVRVLEDRFEFAALTDQPVLHSCRFGEDVPANLGPYDLSGRSVPLERALTIDSSRTLHWTEGRAGVEIHLCFPAVGAVYEPGWHAPLTWDSTGDLRWVDLGSGAGVPALPFRPLRRTP